MKVDAQLLSLYSTITESRCPAVVTLQSYYMKVDAHVTLQYYYMKVDAQLLSLYSTIT